MSHIQRTGREDQKRKGDPRTKYTKAKRTDANGRAHQNPRESPGRIPIKSKQPNITSRSKQIPGAPPPPAPHPQIQRKNTTPAPPHYSPSFFAHIKF